MGDLDGTGTSHQGKWTGTFDILVLDSGGSPVGNATVDGTYTGAYSGTDSCTTGGDGWCSVTSPQVSKSGAGQESMTWTVDDVTHASLTYAPGDNTDPDGDSGGTSITIQKPN